MGGVPTIIKGVPTVTLQPGSARAYRTARPQHERFRKSQWRRYERCTLAYSLETHHKKNVRVSGRIQHCNPYKDKNIWSLQPRSKQFCTWHTSDMPAPIHLLVLPFETLEHESHGLKAFELKEGVDPLWSMHALNQNRSAQLDQLGKVSEAWPKCSRNTVDYYTQML